MPFLPLAEILRVSIRQAIEVQQMQLMFVARALAVQGALRRQMLPARPAQTEAPPTHGPRKARAPARPAMAAE